MSDDSEKHAEIPLSTWKAAFRPGMPEFGATRFVFSREHNDLMRIAFGNEGPYVNSRGERSAPVFTHAVTLPPDIAVDLARLLLKCYAEPKAEGNA
jgi:hypothetical protein